MIQTPRNWSRILFVENPELYLPFLKNEVPAAEKEVQEIRKIFKLYGVNENCKILDLSCGIGRHSIYLAQAGYDVVGTDPSEFYLEYARQLASSQKENLKGTLKFFSAEPSEVSKELHKVGEKEFNVVISMFQSFGYRSIKDDIAHFRDILRIASQNCILIIQSENKEWRIRNFQQHMYYEFNNLVVVEKWTNSNNSDVFQNISTFYSKGDNRLDTIMSLPMTMRLYSLTGMHNLLESAGWENIANYKSLSRLEPVDRDSEMIVTIYNPM